MADRYPLERGAEAPSETSVERLGETPKQAESEHAQWDLPVNVSISQASYKRDAWLCFWAVWGSDSPGWSDSKITR